MSVPRNRTAVPSLGADPAYENGFKLSCGHEEQISGPAGLEPVNRNGWYAARRCPICNRKRKVVSSYVRLSLRAEADRA